jgi:hypothetical protein
MELYPGDLVETNTGKIGRIISTFRMTAFVGFPRLGADDYVSGYLASDLHKIAPDSALSAAATFQTEDRYHSVLCAID